MVSVTPMVLFTKSKSGHEMHVSGGLLMKLAMFFSPKFVKVCKIDNFLISPHFNFVKNTISETQVDVHCCDL